MSARIRAIAVVLITASLASCCGDDVNAVSLEGPAADGLLGPVWVGDTVPAVAVAHHYENMMCYKRCYDSRQRPGAFSYESPDPAVATLSSTGVIIGKSAGFVWLRVSTEGAVDSFPLQVVTPVLRFVQTMEPATPRTGDTITFRVQAIGLNGAPAPSAQFSNMVLPPDLRNIGLDQLLPGPETLQKLVPKSAGEYRFISSQFRTTRDGMQSVADTLRFTVVPPP